MNQLARVFEREGRQVRAVVVEGEPWFVAKDVCEYFGDTNYRRSTARLDEDEKGVSQIDTPGGAQAMTIVTEAGLYTLLFAMQPQKGNVSDEQYEQRAGQIKTFKRWITHEVLPSIRKHGAYMTATALEEALLNPDTMIKLLVNLKAEREKRALAERTLQLQAPKVEFFDAVASSKDAIPIGHAAKVLNMGIGRNRLFEHLRQRGVLMNDNIPYQEYIDRGYFRTIEQKYTTPNGETKISIKTLVYQRGLEYIRKTLADSKVLRA